MELKIEEAMKYIQETDEAQIEKEAGLTWASRAAAAYVLCYQADNKEEKVYWLLRAEDFRHEALEHSSLVSDEGKTLNELEKELDKYRDEAFNAVKL